ncbi:MAG: hypothetical protein JWP35_4455 [Caulobacter sp.]|nr:hypothetical protein [Caulobacter sp.]
MGHHFGICGIDGDRRLPQQVGRPINYPQGPFSTVFTPTKLQIGLVEMPTRVMIGLLVKAPDPDGHGWVECVGDGYPCQTPPPSCGRLDTCAGGVRLSFIE